MTLSSVVLPLQVDNKKIEQHVIFCYTLRGESNGTDNQREKLHSLIHVIIYMNKK